MKRMLSSLGTPLAAGAALVCPVCPSGATTLLASLGVSALASAAVLKPLLVGLLAVALTTLCLGYRRHRNPRPLLLAVPGALGVYGAKWLLPSTPLLYGGITLLIASSLIDAFARRRSRPCCQAAAHQV